MPPGGGRERSRADSLPFLALGLPVHRARVLLVLDHHHAGHGAPRLDLAFYRIPGLIAGACGRTARNTRIYLGHRHDGGSDIPLGVAAAIHLEEFADKTNRLNRIIELNVQNLAAIPSIVYGLLALAFLALLAFRTRTW